jgi:arsenate reductase (glutaredoxin)
MTVTIYGIANCDTMKRARQWLDAQGVSHAFHNYKVSGIERPRLEAWCDVLGWERVLNRAGTTFRRLSEADRVGLTRERAVVLMIAQPSLIKRPVLDVDGRLVVGFAPDIYAETFRGSR